MSSVTCDMEEMTSETARRMQEKRETTLEVRGLMPQKRKRGVEAGTRRRSGDAGSHSFVERGGRRLRES